MGLLLASYLSCRNLPKLAPDLHCGSSLTTTIIDVITPSLLKDYGKPERHKNHYDSSGGEKWQNYQLRLLMITDRH